MTHTHVALLVFALSSCAQQPPAESDNSGGELVQNRGEGKDDWWDALPRPAWGELEKIDQSQHGFEVYKIRDGLFAIYRGETPFVVTDGDREYSFEGFTILTPDPLPGETW